MLLVNRDTGESFSALQRAEIAEIKVNVSYSPPLMSFSALQRAEIAEIGAGNRTGIANRVSFSALQRAEIAEIYRPTSQRSSATGFSALQRAEIAEIWCIRVDVPLPPSVSVLFNEPKLLK